LGWPGCIRDPLKRKGITGYPGPGNRCYADSRAWPGDQLQEQPSHEKPPLESNSCLLSRQRCSETKSLKSLQRSMGTSDLPGGSLPELTASYGVILSSFCVKERWGGRIKKAFSSRRTYAPGREGVMTFSYTAIASSNHWPWVFLHSRVSLFLICAIFVPLLNLLSFIDIDSRTTRQMSICAQGDEQICSLHCSAGTSDVRRKGDTDRSTRTSRKRRAFFRE